MSANLHVCSTGREAARTKNFQSSVWVGQAVMSSAHWDQSLDCWVLLSQLRKASGSLKRPRARGNTACFKRKEMHDLGPHAGVLSSPRRMAKSPRVFGPRPRLDVQSHAMAEPAADGGQKVFLGQAWISHLGQYAC